MIFAHNAMRDMEFINNELNYWNLKMIPKRNFYCTLKIFKEMFPNLSRNYCSLSKCCEYFELLPPAENYHSAIFDSFMAARMVCKFFEIFNEFEKRKNDKLNINKIEKFNNDNIGMRENKILNGDDNLVLQEDQSDFYDINTSFENDGNNNNVSEDNNSHYNGKNYKNNFNNNKKNNENIDINIYNNIDVNNNKYNNIKEFDNNDINYNNINLKQEENKKIIKEKLSDEPIDLDAKDLNDLMKEL
jgi:DNA polymerase III epsilon subunit-like protein